MLKYIGTGICEGPDYVFPIEATEALVSGVYYKSIEKRRNISPGEKRRAQLEYTNHKKIILRDKMRMPMEHLVESLTKPARISF